MSSRATPASTFLASERKRTILTQAVTMIALGLVALVVLFPFYYMIISSVRPPYYRFDAIRIDLLPSQPDWQAWQKILAGGGSAIVNGFGNTLVLEVAIVGGSVILNTLAAYAFAKRNFPGKNLLFTLLLLTIILPTEVTLIPRYLMFRDWQLLNTFWAMILPALTGVFGIFLIRQFIGNIPDAYIDAARIDGANELQVITRIIFPLAMPAISTYALMTFLGVWNDLTGPLIFMNKKVVWTLQVALYVFTTQNSFITGDTYGPEGIRMQTLFAGMLVSAIPTILVFLVFQRQLVAGITLTGLKG